ncbi:hypothetical protein PF010_g18451 [Phytophthora fragariae]|uniref:Uncharacterized protein n=2 Tax=Phytophthora fragariae TaxID=53985 RepID=A0A6A3XQN4_9STRA|nr:hypothetical protein PF010_g18451 [Phytophthora fragariae]KAE9206710.1 hypothetical protein PF002_g19922 [Phytophthora fragariae]KAE9326083.1 hypothetical protein PF008_g16734 [Phytophthora fragariae]
MVFSLIDRIRSAVLLQQEQAATNFLTRVDDVRDFVANQVPDAGVEIAQKMTCFVFESVQNDLSDLNAVNRKPFIVQVTVWDAKKRVGSPRTVPMQFRPGAVYEFRQVHDVGFYADIPKGSVQMEEGATERIVQRAAPILKRKPDRERTGRKFEARCLAMEVDEDEAKDDDHDTGGSGATSGGASGATCGGASAKAPRTRGVAASRS